MRTVRRDGWGWHCGWDKSEFDGIDGTSTRKRKSQKMLPASWMSALNDADTIDELNLPGTHDSGTSYLHDPNYHHTQDMTIGEQLQAGIRYFDMRLRLLMNPDFVMPPDPPEMRFNFTVHHEADWCYLYLDENSWVASQDKDAVKGYVLQDCLQFVKLHPTEFILFQVQQEYDSNVAFSGRFMDIVNRYNAADPVNPPFLVTGAYPTVGDARGKIVLVSSNGALPGSGIQVDSSKLVNTSTLYVENHWMDSNPDLKWNKVEDALKVARQANDGQWVITYVSDGSGAKHPSAFASDLNTRVENTLRAYASDTHCGTILTDFPTPGLIGAILRKYA